MQDNLLDLNGSDNLTIQRADIYSKIEQAKKIAVEKINSRQPVDAFYSPISDGSSLVCLNFVDLEFFTNDSESKPVAKIVQIQIKEFFLS